MAIRSKISPAHDVCVVYCRVSSEKQAREDKGSLDDQERNGLAKAHALGLHVLYTVKDPESAWVLDKRTKFQKVLDDARAGKFEVLVVDRMNRFTRSEDLGEYMEVMTALKLAGVRPVFADKEYEDSPTGQLLMTMDAYVSAMEQGNRRKQSLVGKRKRVNELQRPIPGSWALYGYKWVDDKTKVALEKDPGESQRVVDDIWRYFLHGERPTLYSMANILNSNGVKTPREYAGITRAKNAVASGPRWSAETVRYILQNPVYWGGDDGQVPAFTWSKHNERKTVPAYAPPYVTPEQAARVHARLTSNWKFASRRRKKEWDLLLYGGLARCAECGWALEVSEYKRPRADGSLLRVYRCSQSNQFGIKVCKGVTINAEALDYAVVDVLTMELARGDYLKNLFAAWDRDAEAASSNVRSISQTLADTREKIANGNAWLLSYKPGDPNAAPMDAQVRMLQDTIPGLEKRLRQAQESVATARNNPALRDELAEWFDAWMNGYQLLSRAKQRDFLFAIQAKVLLWRAGERTPRAQLRIALPTAPLTLPPSPFSTLQQDPETGAWTMDLDIEEASKAVEDYRRSGAEAAFAAIVAEAKAEVTAGIPQTAGDIMDSIKDDLWEQGFGESLMPHDAEPDAGIATSAPRRPRRGAGGGR